MYCSMLGFGSKGQKEGDHHLAGEFQVNTLPENISNVFFMFLNFLFIFITCGYIIYIDIILYLLSNFSPRCLYISAVSYIAMELMAAAGLSPNVTVSIPYVLGSSPLFMSRRRTLLICLSCFVV